jgi:hypothetical protein
MVKLTGEGARERPFYALSCRITAAVASSARRSEVGWRATGWGCTWKMRSGTAYVASTSQPPSG